MTSQGQFALRTAVAPEKSQREIRDLLDKYGTEDFEMLVGKHRLGVAFRMKNRTIRFAMPMPDENASDAAYQQGTRSRWRALLLVIKGKLESVELGVESLDEAFMGQIVMPDNQTVAEWMTPQLDTIFQQGKMPPLLSDGRK